MMIYALIIPDISCPISTVTVIVHTVWFILFLSQNYVGKLQYQTETKEMQKTLKAKKTICYIKKKIYWKVTAFQ